MVALNEIASSIKIVRLRDKITLEITEINIEFFSKNEDMSNKWTKFLSTLEYSINNKTQKYLRDVISNKIKNFKIAQNNQVEDVEREIEATYKNYELNIKMRLSFLKEQAEIARVANIRGVAKINNLDIPVSTNEVYYYLKGYDVIEKEIELIKARKDSYLFEKNIILLQTKKFKIENDQTITRLKAKYEASPIFNTGSFSAGTIVSTSTELVKSTFDMSMKKMIIGKKH